MPDRYMQAILKHLAERAHEPVKVRQLARIMGIPDEDYGTFRQAVKRLREAGRVVLGQRNALLLPEPGKRIIGTYRANPRGFGFVVPEQPNSHGDLYIPKGDSATAMTGDRVVARVRKRGKRGGQMVYSGQIIQILHRGNNRFVGELQHAEETWFVVPEGSGFTCPIVVNDPSAAGIAAAGPKTPTKVVVEIVKYPCPGELPQGVILEKLGQAGALEVETLAIIRAYGLAEEFSPQALAEARAAVDAFDPGELNGREDLGGQTVVTIDPPDARDFDDAIGLTRNGDGTVTLGVHIADVSHFVAEGGELDAEARNRATSVYFPRKVLPMLPEILSNGVCSLQEHQRRYCKSVFITYDDDGNVINSRAAETVVRSTKRLTYTQAQDICDGRTGGYDSKVIELLEDMDRLSRKIEARRLAAGMLQLELPEIEPVIDENDRVVDAAPADDSYSHRVIEMFMVEANESVARLFDQHDRPILRRIHAEPEPTSRRQLSQFVRAAGHKLPRKLTRQEMQRLLSSVKGRPEAHAVNLALLKMMQQAEYSPTQVGHFALASECYCHFTSPIRRYPDLTVHRMVTEYCRGRLETRPPEDIPALAKLGQSCTAAEQRAEDAERELNEVLLLQLLETKIGERHDGVVTGVTNFGLFVELARYGIDGLVRFEDLGDDWWEVDARKGLLRGERSGRSFHIGETIAVRIAGVNVARRQLDLTVEGGK
ncbi:MAG: ribonuclease R [Planctomycetota bacterium]